MIMLSQEGHQELNETEEYKKALEALEDSQAR